MSAPITLTIDGRSIQAEPGQTVLEAAEAAGIYIPRLCHHPELSVHGSCRVCTVTVNGRHQASCAFPAGEAQVVEVDTPELTDLRRQIVELLFAEGNHYCMFCEKSGDCELQAVGYRLGITHPRWDLHFPTRGLDATHPDVLLDHDRCILCARCVHASQELDGKNVFQLVGRGAERHIAVDAESLGATDLDRADRAVDACPVGAILHKNTAFRTPVGERPYDHAPIGRDVEEVNR